MERRLAAAVALLAYPVAVIVLILGVLSNAGGAALALAGWLVLSVGGWYLVSRRGAMRALAVVLMLAGVGAIIAGLVIASPRLWAIVVFAAVVVVGVGAARYALGKTARSLRAAPLEGRRHGPARHPVLLMNPKSGGGKVGRFGLVAECQARGIEPVVLEPGDDLVALAEDAVARGADVIGMAGGDGSQALVATVASKHGLPHVVVPAGTRNHLALDLGLDRDNVVGALDAFADGVEHAVDLATVNGRVFVNNASLGLYAKIVQAPEYREAKVKTAANMLPDLLGPDAEALDLRFSGPDGEERPGSQLLLVSNDPYRLDRLAGGSGTRPQMNRGVLGIAALQVANTAAARRLAALESAGQLRRFSGWLEWAAPRFRVDSAGPVEIGVDGEALTMDPPLLFETMPGALRVLLPPQALGQSPAARALDHSSLGDLVTVARGK
ncbi:MAG TPA: diacylglycerol kinase family protein [Streptosporangiaceae bacterium]|nr:diacylglycerol kinase family protein [Streptosporangiaceae bacterium]